MAEGIVRVKCVGRYVNDPKNLRFFPGDEFEADPHLWGLLSSDAPECFVLVEAKAMASPPRDKAVKAPKVGK